MPTDSRFIHPVGLYTAKASSAEESLLEGKANKRTFELGEVMSGILDKPFEASAPLVQFIAKAIDPGARDELFERATLEVSSAFETFSWLIGPDDGSYAFGKRERAGIPDPNIGGIQRKGKTEILVTLLL